MYNKLMEIIAQFNTATEHMKICRLRALDEIWPERLQSIQSALPYLPSVDKQGAPQSMYGVHFLLCQVSTTQCHTSGTGGKAFNGQIRLLSRPAGAIGQGL